MHFCPHLNSFSPSGSLSSPIMFSNVSQRVALEITVLDLAGQLQRVGYKGHASVAKVGCKGRLQGSVARVGCKGQHVGYKGQLWQGGMPGSSEV